MSGCACISHRTIRHRALAILRPISQTWNRILGLTAKFWFLALRFLPFVHTWHTSIPILARTAADSRPTGFLPVSETERGMLMQLRFTVFAPVSYYRSHGKAMEEFDKRENPWLKAKKFQSTRRFVDKFDTSTFSDENRS